MSWSFMVCTCYYSLCENGSMDRHQILHVTSNIHHRRIVIDCCVALWLLAIANSRRVFGTTFRSLQVCESQVQWDDHEVASSLHRAPCHYSASLSSIGGLCIGRYLSAQLSNMAEQWQAAMTEMAAACRQTSLLQHRRVANSVLPADMEQLPQTLYMECSITMVYYDTGGDLVSGKNVSFDQRGCCMFGLVGTGMGSHLQVNKSSRCVASHHIVIAKLCLLFHLHVCSFFYYYVFIVKSHSWI